MQCCRMYRMPPHLLYAAAVTLLLWQFCTFRDDLHRGPPAIAIG
jgi:hypothetical protein